MSAAEKKYSTFDRELLAVFLAIKHFRHVLEGRRFSVLTDHKPLCGALASLSERSPRQTRHLSFIAEFTSSIFHVSGPQNVVADALSRPVTPSSVSSLQQLPDLDLDALAGAQRLCREEMNSYNTTTSLSLQDIPLPSGSTILCDVSTPISRPVVPASWVDRVFQCVHGLSHQGSNASVADVKRRFVWHRVSADVRRLCQECRPCQRSKVTRHTRAPLQDLPLPRHRFQVLNLDLVGPLPTSEGHTYLLTVIDRYSRWVEALPLTDITAATCASAFLRGWIARFGVPAQVITDQGRQFTSNLWREVLAILGISPVLTTSYHPQSNGMICLLYTSPSPRDLSTSRMPSSA